MAIFNTLLGIQAATQATQLSQNVGLTRRGFLAGLGGLTALTVFGCETSESGPDGSHPGTGDGGSGGGTDAGVPSNFVLQDHYATLPCHYSADLEFVNDRMVGVSTPGGSQAGDRNALFQFNPDGALPIASATELDFTSVSGRTLAHFARKIGSRGIVTANDGFYEITLGSPTQTRFISFPSGITYGGGAMYVGSKLFIAAANLNSSLTYDPGQVLVYDVDTSNAVQAGSVRQIATSRRNPTGVALRGADRLVVLNSGRYGNVGSGTLDQGSIDVINTSAESVARTIELGALYAQLGGEIALSQDGKKAVIGTADGSGKVLFVDLDTGAVQEQQISGTQFHSSVKIDANYGIVYVTDFNTGKVAILDLASRAIIRSIDLAAGASGNVEAGPSEIYDGSLIQTLPYGAVMISPA